MKKRIKITLVKSLIGKPENHRKTIRGLGLNKLNQSFVYDLNPSILGMVFKIQHLIKTEIYDYETK